MSIDKNNSYVLYEDEKHKFIWLGWSEGYEEGIVQTNQYLIIDNNRGILLDPGGVHLFSKVVSEVTKFIDLNMIDIIFYSHQDPDVSSGISLWLGITNAKIYVSDLWTRFFPHFGVVNIDRVIGIPSEGMSISLPYSELVFIPSHFLHSTGNFSCYDTKSKILFSGDIGAAVFQKDTYVFVENFDEHLNIMEGFHKRYMASNIACKKWVSIVSKYDINMIAPQHGAIFNKENSKKFLEWLSNLKCGIDIIDQIYKK